ncbi:MAG: substrate-binding domain-containing protein [Granulosicoccus sp.]|nr:substrate-binding domain-containing protein [Granulosicoccus sp.]
MKDINKEFTTEETWSTDTGGGAVSKARSNVARALDVLSSFDNYNNPLRTSVLLTHLGISSSTGFALIKAMLDVELLEKSSHGYIQLGPTARRWIFTPFSTRYLVLLKMRRLTNGSQKELRPFPLIPRAALWNPDLVDTVNTEGFSSPGPYRISFSNASLSNYWRIALLRSMRYAVHSHGTNISAFNTICAEDNPEKQCDDIDTLMKRGTDILLVSAVNSNNPQLIDKLQAVMNSGVPVVGVDRSPGDPSAMVSFVAASDVNIGRISAVWLAEHLQGKGRIWMLSGTKGTSPAIQREKAARQVFSQFPDIHVEALMHTNWQPEGGSAAVRSLLNKYPTPADGIWCDSGLQGIGSIDTFVQDSLPIPPHTGGNLNFMYKLAIKQHVPFVALDYPAAMGAKAVETGLDIKAGKTVLKKIETNVQVVIPRGFETLSIKADEWAELHVRWQLSDDYVLSQGASLYWNDREYSHA